MKIPNELEFKDQNVLLIVAGKQDAVLYKAENENMQRLDAFKIPKPHYSDNEGNSRTRGRGITARSGAGKELRDEDIIRDFLHLFKERAKKLHDFSKVYIFAATKTKNRIASALPYTLQRRVSGVFSGNYFSINPIELVRKIWNSETKHPLPISLEAKEILDGWDKARNFA
jgi:hypothetical protein